MTCEQIEELLAAGATGNDLNAGELGLVRAHLEQCSQCQEAASIFGATAALLAVGLEPVAPPPQLRIRVLGAAISPEPAQTAADSVAHLPVRRWSPWRPSRSKLYGFGGGLAALAAGILIGAGMFHNGASPALTAAINVPMHGTTAAPQASGQLTYDPVRQQAVIEVGGLPTLVYPQVYQLWAMRSDNSVLPAGYLSQATNGSWTAVMDGNMANDAAIAATLEPKTGLIHPSGPEMVQGDMPR